jgi:glycerol-3-phosphate acyltransferase PlsX
MAQATRTLGLIEGTRRPAIAQALPTYHGYTVLIDVGANVDCRPEDLVQFAIMGDLYAQAVMDESAPKVGLLSVGTEEAKGSPLTKQALALLRETPLNFVGNVEGSDIFNGTLDVVVCDGFTGNVVLKLAESLVELLETALLEELLRTKKSKLGLKLSKVALRRFKHRFDHAEIGCAPLLGVNGVVAISHGRSKARSIHNAIRRAQEIVSFNLNQRIREALSQIDQPSPNSAKKLL